MKKCPCSMPFNGTPEQEAKLKAVIEEKKHIDGCLMQIMQDAQEIYGYLPIEDALDHSLGLDRVFVIATKATASASEIIINGLRGLDIEVNIVGTRTSGKNVGMEGFSRRFRNYDFLLYPVSFYIENAKGFRDYPEGFEPDFKLDDSSFYPGGDFGSNSDFLCNAVYGWIRTGNKPSFRSSKANVLNFVEPVADITRVDLGGSRGIYRD